LRCILVVEDNESLLSVIERYLRRAGHEVLTAGNATEARAALASDHQIELMIFDIGLPDGNGLDLLQEAQRGRPSMGAIAITASENDADKLRARELGVGAYITKPFSLIRMLSSV
jgi:DNA-binding response OmpR family regulator